MTKPYYRTCEANNCNKGTNQALHILTDRSEKTALCSKHYKEWLIIKSKYYQLALKEFFESK